MSYEYESQMGYLEPGYWPLRRRVVEVYGTMPEAQEFVQEEFNLPYLPPAYALQPPMNPKTAPYRRITTLPVSIPITAMGTNGASSGQTFFERYRGWLIAGGVIVGGYFLARAFGLIGGSRNRTIFGNPPVKDYKLQEENAFGWIPSTTGRYPGREQDAARSGWMILRNPYETPITLEQLLRIEREAYPEHMREMQWAEDWEDIADYSEVPLKRLVILSDGATWYAIIAKHRLGRAEFVDLAKIPGAPMIDWFFILRTLRELGVKRIFGDMRDDTSYRRFKQQLAQFESLGVRMTKDEVYERDGELFHDFVIRI